jgi:hypothetical protein
VRSGAIQSRDDAPGLHRQYCEVEVTLRTLSRGDAAETGNAA